jgi:hypothetical protein
MIGEALRIGDASGICPADVLRARVHLPRRRVDRDPQSIAGSRALAVQMTEHRFRAARKPGLEMVFNLCAAIHVFV